MEEDCVWPQRLLTMGQEEEEEDLHTDLANAS